MTCDSMVSAEVVTADGELLFASESSNSDLFWALRGGGGNFGVVTSFEFQAHSVGPVVAFAGPTYALGSTSRVLEGMRGFAETMADKVNLAANLWTVPPAPAFPENLHGQAVVTLAATFVGSVDQGEAVLMPLREIDDLVMDLSGPLPYVQLQQLFDPFFPAGELQHYWKSLYLLSWTKPLSRPWQRLWRIALHSGRWWECGCLGERWAGSIPQQPPPEIVVRRFCLRSCPPGLRLTKPRRIFHGLGHSLKRWHLLPAGKPI